MTPPERQPMIHGPEMRARLGLSYLEQELLAQERGEEPDLGRVLGALRAVRSALLRAGAKRAAELGSALRHYLEELREDAGGLSLEDVDIVLSAMERMRHLVENEHAIDAWIDGVTPARTAANDTRPDELVYAPEFRESGLYWEMRSESVQLGLPSLGPRSDTSGLINDLKKLWGELPEQLPWTLRPKHLERIPVSLVSALIRLRQRDGAGARRIRLEGSAGGIQSPALTESLDRCFATT